MSPPLLNVLLPALLALASAAEPPPDIARLLEQLGSPNFEEREAASKALEKIGEPALEALRVASRSPDAEVRRRAAELFKAIEARTKDRTIRVVATWADLLRQPVIDAGGGVRVRLGISATRCPRWSGVLLYAYAEGYGDYRPSRTNCDRLGPLWISIRFGSRFLDAPNEPRLPRRWSEVPRTRQLLFARPVMIDNSGRYSIAVRTEAGGEVGSAVVTGTEDPAKPFHPWSPLLHLEDAQYLTGVGAMMERTAPAVATNPGQGIALPLLMGDMHLAEAPKAPARMARLPALLPEEAGGMKLTIDPETLLLRVEAGRAVTAFACGCQFLARWWVNGRPFLPRPARPTPRKGDLGTLYQFKDVEIQLRLDATKLGARPGDRVELQLMYCPWGWAPVENPQRLEGGGSELPVMTNRVAFRVP
jgi:hypothetical protein